jgi:hypothetical protein
MIRYFLLSFVFMLFLVSCRDQVKPVADKALIKSTIEALMGEQESAWNSGSLEGFMKHYWQNDSMKFVGKNGISYGWQRTLDNYRKSYPDAEARGILKFNNLYAEVLSDSSAFVIGKWTLFRSADTLSGHYSLLWKKINSSWVIVADHSS